MLHWRRVVGIKSATGLLLLSWAAAPGAAPLPAQETELGAVRGVVQTRDGRPVGGFWLMLVNPELGMNYRVDVNSIGQFAFTDIYPGTYIFKISPYSYTVVSPGYLDVKGGDDQEVKVIVARAPGSAGGIDSPARSR